MSYYYVTDLDFGFNSSTCCPNLMIDVPEWYCEKYHESIGSGSDGDYRAKMYCGQYKRTSACWLALDKERIAEERATKEKAVAETKAQLDRTISNFSEQIRLNPNDAEAYRSRGVLYCQREMYDQAIGDYNEAIRIAPNNAKDYEGRGMAYCGKNNYDQSIADFTEAIRLNPNSKNAYKLRGAAYGMTEEHDKSISDYQAALRLDLNDKTISFALKNAKRLKKQAWLKDKKKYLMILSSVSGGIVGGVAFGLVSAYIKAELMFAVIVFFGLYGYLSARRSDAGGFGCVLGLVVGGLIFAAFANLQQWTHIPIGVLTGALIGYNEIREYYYWNK